ncbi:Uncharacterised protein [Klebsiella pneumoniae]|jgi:hypothetical protein|uniref:hypothetical protein n=1 Tax=Klebsiella pneumoniae TaxID=573 RepID=UPI00108453A0|nr:hypothetical protein [Klebsiella pneumoniae]VGH57604.1 Uncharacterised protein [Klebsiella pneumoniae]
MSLIRKMTLHTHPRGIELETGRKRVISHRDEKGKRWIIEMTLRDPEEELKNKKEEEYNAKQIKNNR